MQYGFRRFLLTFALASLRLCAYFALTAYWHVALSALLLLLSGVHLLLILNRIRGMGLRVWAHDMVHLLEVAATVLQLAVAVAALLEDSEGCIDPNVLAILTLVIWVDFILSHLRGFEAVSALLTQTRGIIIDSGPFIFVLVVTIAGALPKFSWTFPNLSLYHALPRLYACETLPREAR